MSRTIRKVPLNCYRTPKTFREMRQIESLKTDPDIKLFNLTSPNRLNKYVPNSWDYLVPSAWYQIPSCRFKGG